MSSINEASVEKKLKAVTNTQDSIQGLSLWILHHKAHHKKIVELWFKVMKKEGAAGWLPERLAKDSIWNRTVNLAGGSGRNLEADLVNEFLNKEFKESLKAAGGNLTEETVARHSQMVGSMGRLLDEIFLDAIEAEHKQYIKKEKADMNDDIRTFVTTLAKENLLTKVPAHEFSAFAKFKYSIQPSSSAGLKKRMEHLSNRLDMIRRVTKSFQ